MLETIIGVGSGRKLADVLELAEREIIRVQGSPRKLLLTARGLELEATRPSFDGSFQTIQIQLEREKFEASELDSVAQLQFATAGETDRDGWQAVTFQAADAEQAVELHKSLGEAWSMKLPDVWRIRGDGFPQETLSPAVVFEQMVELGASDVHLYPGSTPMFRVDNKVQSAGTIGVLSSQQILEMVRAIAPIKAWNDFENDNQCSFRYHQVGVGYARVSAFIKGEVPHCTFRFLPEQIPSFEELRIPADKMTSIGELHYGLVLVTGMTGSGKSTTVASLINWLNRNKSVHILTVEDPIEYVHVNEKSVVSQREVGLDVDTFRQGVHGALRHDPDVIFIGEMRDADTVRAAISAAATGHLVISTMHASTAGDVVNQIISFFSPVERDLVRLQLRDSLRCVVCQRLLPKPRGGRIALMEFMFNDTEHIGEAIYEGNADTLRTCMQQTLSKSSMFEEHLLEIIKEEIFELEEAMELAPNPHILEQMHLGTYAVPRLDQQTSLTSGFSSSPSRGLGSMS